MEQSDWLICKDEKELSDFRKLIGFDAFRHMLLNPGQIFTMYDLRTDYRSGTLAAGKACADAHCSPTFSAIRESALPSLRAKIYSIPLVFFFILPS